MSFLPQLLLLFFFWYETISLMIESYKRDVISNEKVVQGVLLTLIIKLFDIFGCLSWKVHALISVYFSN